MNTKEKDIFPELSKFKEASHSLATAMNMASRSLVDFVKERDRLLAEIEQLKKERAELEAERDIYDQFIKESNELWQLITRLCLNANPPIRVREHTIKSLKEAGVQVKGRISKLELWRGDELVGVVINTSQNKWK